MRFNSIVDVSDDNQHAIYEIIEKEVHVPSFVKVASQAEEKRVYALPDLKKFPCDTPSDVWLSNQYLKKTASNLSKYHADLAKANIQKYASWLGINLESKQKEANIEIVYDIPVESFAVSASIDSMNRSFLTKHADNIYNDHFVLYPLNNQENIKRANMNFPLGLEDDLEGFRPMVAQAIAEKVKSDELSSEVKKYLPIKKSAAIEQIDYRMNKYPMYKEQYQQIKNLLEKDSPDILKVATYLEQVDERIGLNSLYSDSFLSPIRYLQGIVDDKDYSAKKVKMASSNILFCDLIKKKANLLDSIPGINENHLISPDSFEAFFNRQPKYLQMAIETITNE